MPRKAPTPLSDFKHRFESSGEQSNRIMFCKRYKVRDKLEIAPGAILLLEVAHVGMIKICQALYQENSEWFIGDVEALLAA